MPGLGSVTQQSRPKRRRSFYQRRRNAQRPEQSQKVKLEDTAYDVRMRPSSKMVSEHTERLRLKLAHCTRDFTQMTRLVVLTKRIMASRNDIFFL